MSELSTFKRGHSAASAARLARSDSFPLTFLSVHSQSSHTPKGVPVGRLGAAGRENGSPAPSWVFLPYKGDRLPPTYILPGRAPGGL